MVKLNVLLVGAVLLGAVAARAEERTWLAPDFFVDTTSVGEPFAAYTFGATDCRANIREALCVVATPFERRGLTMSRGCQANPVKYQQFFEGVYDRLPPVLQRMFCSVRTLYVEPNLESIAYAGVRGAGAVVGFRKSVIDESLELSTLLSWKEQLPFGGTRDAYEPAKDLPNITIQSRNLPISDLAFYVLAHEFGHLLDFANGLNTSCFPGASCVAEPGSWTALAWQTTQRPKPAADFPYRRNICYYNCSGNGLPQKAIAPVYAGLSKTSFVTVYAGTNVYDDLAESLAFYYLDREGDISYTLDTRQGATYDMLAKVRAPQFAEKKQYLEAFLQRSDIAYP